MARRLFVNVGMSEASVTLTRQIRNMLRQVGFLSGSFWGAEDEPLVIFLFFSFAPLLCGVICMLCVGWFSLFSSVGVAEQPRQPSGGCC